MAVTAIQGIDYMKFMEPSDSGRDDHEVRLWLREWRGFKPDSLSCDCRKWRFQNKGIPIYERRCHHTDRVAERLRRTSVIERVWGSEVTFKPVEPQIVAIPVDATCIVKSRVEVLMEELKDMGIPLIEAK